MTLERALFTVTSSPQTVSNSLNSVKLSGAAVSFDVARGWPQNQRRRSIKFTGKKTLISAARRTTEGEPAGEAATFMTWLDIFLLMDREKKMCEWQLIFEAGLFIVTIVKLHLNGNFGRRF